MLLQFDSLLCFNCLFLNVGGSECRQTGSVAGDGPKGGSREGCHEVATPKLRWRSARSSAWCAFRALRPAGGPAPGHIGTRAAETVPACFREAF